MTRMTKNAQSKQGIENPTVADIRCYSSRTAPEVAVIPVGAVVHYISTQQINHPGPMPVLSGQGARRQLRQHVGRRGGRVVQVPHRDASGKEQPARVAGTE